MTNPACSDPAAPTRRLVALEGMPGAGKTTAARALRDSHPVVGEYTTAAGATIPDGRHPGVGDDHVHQANWLIKARIASAHLATAPTVVCDRDWLSSLAYAYTVPDGGDLLRRRCRWAQHHLRAGSLRTADRYVILDVDADTSLERRAHRLTTGHPWSTRAGLTRLRAFYRHPAAALADEAPPLANRLAAADLIRVAADQPPGLVLAAITATLAEVPR